MTEIFEIFGLGIFTSVKFLFGQPALAVYFESILKPILVGIPFGWLGMLTFFYSASFFMRRSSEKRLRKIKELEAAGKPYKKKKAFTRVNKFIVRVKQKELGMVLIALSGPVLISIPVSAIIVAKFYRDSKLAPIMLLGSVVIWAIVLTLITALPNGYPLY